MNIGIIDKPIPSAEDRAVILHEFGHAMGLGHEWDGESSQVASSHHDEALRQHISAHGERNVSNFPQQDDSSIMKCVKILSSSTFAHDPADTFCLPV
jgi:hypothetical protein